MARCAPLAVAIALLACAVQAFHAPLSVRAWRRQGPLGSTIDDVAALQNQLSSYLKNKGMSPADISEVLALVKNEQLTDKKIIGQIRASSKGPSDGSPITADPYWEYRLQRLMSKKQKELDFDITRLDNFPDYQSRYYLYFMECCVKTNMEGFDFTAEETMTEKDWAHMLDAQIKQMEEQSKSAGAMVIPNDPWDAVRAVFPWYKDINDLYAPLKKEIVGDLADKYPTLKDLLIASLEKTVVLPAEARRFNTANMQFDVDFLIKEVEAKKVETIAALEAERARLEALAAQPPASETEEIRQQIDSAFADLQEFLKTRPHLKTSA